LLQPFAENAVIHGLQNKPDNRMLKIEVRKSDEAPDSERLAVSNYECSEDYFAKLK
jgi:sensor histidine kinase YesM